MEEVLDLYEEPYDPKKPMICFDEQPYQMLSEVRDPLPIKPGQPERVDFEYQREGNAYVHMAFEPLKGFREVEITERRRSVEFAHLMEHLVDDLYPKAEKIRVVLDNLFRPTRGRPSTRLSPQSGHEAWPQRSSSSTHRCTARG